MSNRSSPGRRAKQVSFKKNAVKNASRIKVKKSKTGSAAESNPKKVSNSALDRLSKSTISFSKSISKYIQERRKR